MADFSVNVGDDFLTVDLENVEEWGGSYELPAPGNYLLQVDKAATSTASTGTPMLEVEAVIVGNAKGGATDQENRRIFQKYFPAGKEAARARLKQFLNASGALNGNGFSVSGLVGRRFVGEVYIEPGKPYTDADTGEQKDGKAQARIRNEKRVA